MKKFTTSKTVRSVFAVAMAMTLAMPTTLCVTTEAAEDSILESALATYDFEGGTDSLNREGEQYLKLENGKPVIENGAYAMVESTALPEVIEDADKGKVLEFKDSTKIDKYSKTKADATEAAVAEGVDVVSDAALNKEYAVGDLIQQVERIGGRVKLDNPYKGMTFDESDENAGVSISYWVKVPVIKYNTETREKVAEGADTSAANIIDRGANSTTVVFNNTGRIVMNKDDQMKHFACVGYDEAVASNDTEALKDYDLGTQKIVKDEAGNAYVLYENYGKLLRFNPNYPDAAASGQAAEAVAGTTGVAKKGGWYAMDEKDKGIKVTDSEGKEYRISSFTNEGSSTEDSNQYEQFRYRYKAEDDKANGYSSKSKVREGEIDGSLQISTDNDFGYREDDYREESYLDTKGETVKKAVDGAKVHNPNSDKDGTIQTFRHYNQFYFDGDEYVTTLDGGAEEWHYVTIVIQNDWVVTYVDGVAADPEVDYQYMKETPGLAGSQHDFGSLNTGKMFNKGKGLRGIFGLGDANVADWSTNGTAKDTPANSVGMTILEWLADEGTELYLGGTGYGSEALGQGYGTIEGVCLDDVSFFATALTEDDVIALYDEVAAGGSAGSMGDVDGNGNIDLSDAQLALKAALKIETLDSTQTAAADVDANGKVELPDAQKILKVALKIETF